MGLNPEARRRLAVRGLTSVDALGEWTPEGFDKAITSIEREHNAVDPADPGNPAPPFQITVQSLTRIRESIKMVRYYKAIGREPTAANMRWNPMGIFFQETWEGIEARTTANNEEPPLLSKMLPILPWISSFESHLLRVVGAQSYPLAYVIRAEADPPLPCPLNAPDRPFSPEFNSLVDELVARVSHRRGQYTSDNALVFTAIQKAVMGTQYSGSVEPFNKNKDGRGAFEALKRQHAGEAVWKLHLKKAEQVLHNSKWKGQTSSYTLEKFAANHRDAFLQLQKCSEHLQYQLPNENTRVTYWLDGIECSDSSLSAVMSLLRKDNGPGGMMNDFELAVAYLLPSDPVAKMRANVGHEPTRGTGGTKRGNAQISSLDASKIGIGETGVHFRFYKPDDFKLLTDPQRAELKAHRLGLMAKGHSGKLPVIDDGKGSGNHKKSRGGKKKGKKNNKGKAAPNPTTSPPPAVTATVSALTAVTTTIPNSDPVVDPVVPPTSLPVAAVAASPINVPAEAAVAAEPRPRSNGNAPMTAAELAYWGYSADFFEDVVVPKKSDKPNVVDNSARLSGLQRYRINKDHSSKPEK